MKEKQLKSPKARECKTDEDFSAYIDNIELKLSDDAVESVTGGIQAGDVMRKLRTEFVNTVHKPKLPPVHERYQRFL